MSDATNGGPPLLELRDIVTYYGEINILTEASLQIGAGELVCLLGGNASGKSTTLTTILGLVGVSSGELHLSG